MRILYSGIYKRRFIVQLVKGKSISVILLYSKIVCFRVNLCEIWFVFLFLPIDVFSLRQCATVDCSTRVHEPSFSFEISEKDVFYSNLNKGKIKVTK